MCNILTFPPPENANVDQVTVEQSNDVAEQRDESKKPVISSGIDENRINMLIGGDRNSAIGKNFNI
jgi:hypothetical protein